MNFNRKLGDYYAIRSMAPRDVSRPPLSCLWPLQRMAGPDPWTESVVPVLVLDRKQRDVVDTANLH